jgi:hypothetical protein
VADNVPITAGSGTNVATDERTVGGATVHIQRVSEIGSGSIANGQVTVSNAAVTIAAARDTRKRLVIVNRESVSVFVGVATVTTANGVELLPGDSLTLYTTALVQGITAAASTEKVHYIEEYD